MLYKISIAYNLSSILMQNRAHVVHDQSLVVSDQEAQSMLCKLLYSAKFLMPAVPRNLYNAKAKWPFLPSGSLYCALVSSAHSSVECYVRCPGSHLYAQCPVLAG